MINGGYCGTYFTKDGEILSLGLIQYLSLHACLLPQGQTIRNIKHLQYLGIFEI